MPKQANVPIFVGYPPIPTFFVKHLLLAGTAGRTLRHNSTSTFGTDTSKKVLMSLREKPLL